MPFTFRILFVAFLPGSNVLVLKKKKLKWNYEEIFFILLRYCERKYALFPEILPFGRTGYKLLVIRAAPALLYDIKEYIRLVFECCIKQYDVFNIIIMYIVFRLCKWLRLLLLFKIYILRFLFRLIFWGANVIRENYSNLCNGNVRTAINFEMIFTFFRYSVNIMVYCRLDIVNRQPRSFRASKNFYRQN